MAVSPKKKEAPAEPFKRVLGFAVRAIAGDDEVQVNYAPGKPEQDGKSIQLPEFLDDGGVIARRIIQLPNRDEDMGAMLVRSMVLRQYERVGDGTATAVVLLEAIFNAGVRYLAAGGNAMPLRRHLETRCR